jgi:hypothetical protein
LIGIKKENAAVENQKTLRMMHSQNLDKKIRPINRDGF